jgi:alpha-tubulin suppressor-like RCC1 family protein
VARGFEVTFGTPVLGLNGANPLTNIWGMPYVDPGIVSTGAPVAIAAGRAHTFALKQDGAVIGWGDNSSGQTNVPSGANNALAVSTGEDHGIVMRANGTVYGWGDNSLGQTNAPVTATNVVAIASGESFNLALRRNGTVVGWGDDFLRSGNRADLRDERYRRRCRSATQPRAVHQREHRGMGI